MLIIFALRGLLLAPHVRARSDGAGGHMYRLLPAGVMLFAAEILAFQVWEMEECGRARGAGRVSILWNALGEGHAVAALGWDVLIAVASLGIYLVMGVL